MKLEPTLHYQSVLRGISERVKWKSSFVADVSVFAGLLAILYALFASGRIWFAPFTPVANISSSPRALPLYAAYSFVRIAIAYITILKSSLTISFAGMTVSSKGTIGRSAAMASRSGVRGLTGMAFMRSTKV